MLWSTGSCYIRTIFAWSQHIKAVLIISEDMLWYTFTPNWAWRPTLGLGGPCRSYTNHTVQNSSLEFISTRHNRVILNFTLCCNFQNSRFKSLNCFGKVQMTMWMAMHLLFFRWAESYNSRMQGYGNIHFVYPPYFQFVSKSRKSLYRPFCQELCFPCFFSLAHFLLWHLNSIMVTNWYQIFIQFGL